MPGSNVATAERTSSGERSRSSGYARSSFERLALGTDASTSRAPSRAEIVISRQPILEGKMRSANVSARPLAAAEKTASNRSVFEAPRSATRDDTVRHGPQDDPAAVEPELELRATVRGEAGGADVVAELERRDLGQVEDVAHVDAVARQLDRGVVVDGEVAERMRARGAGRGEHERESRRRAVLRSCEASTRSSLPTRACSLQARDRFGGRDRRRAGPVHRGGC